MCMVNDKVTLVTCHEGTEGSERYTSTSL